MNKKPIVSVIMPSLNVEPYIRQCMDSVLNQTLKNIELICIDAGSTDGTLEILQEYTQKDDRIRLIHSDRKSYGYQVNIGFTEAKAEYVGVVETDDYTAPEMYESLYSAANGADNPDIVKSGYYVIQPSENGTYEDGEIIRKCKIHKKTGSVFQLPEHYELLIGHPSIWTCIYKTEFLRKKKITMVEAPGGGWVDVPFLFQTLCEAERICWVNEPLYYYRRSNPNASSYLKDCSIPTARINDCKDYLERRFPSDRALERRLYHRALHYFAEIENNPHCTDENRREIKEAKKRFHLSVAFRVRTGKLYRKIRSVLSSSYGTRKSDIVSENAL